MENDRGYFEKESLSWKQIRDAIHYVASRQDKTYCIYGPAGCGKTHNVCSIASKLIKRRMFICALVFSSARTKTALLLKSVKYSTSRMKTIWRNCRKKRKEIQLISVQDVQSLSLMHSTKDLMTNIGVRVWALLKLNSTSIPTCRCW